MSVQGKFIAVCNTSSGAASFAITHVVEGDTLTGELEMMGNSNAIRNATMDGNNFKYYANISTPIGALVATVSGKVAEDSIVGKIATDMATVDFSGNRV